MHDLGKRFKRARKRAGLTQAKLSALSGVAQSTISDIENGGREISAHNLFKLSTAMRCSIASFFDEDTACASSVLPSIFLQLSEHHKTLLTGLANELVSLSEKKPIDHGLLDVSGYAAAGLPLYDDILFDSQIKVPLKYQDKKRYFVIQARGQSMEPLINDGDFVIVQKDGHVDSGSLALVQVQGSVIDEYSIKIIEFVNGLVRLISKNPSFDVLQYSMKDIISVQKIVHVINISE